MKNSPGVLTNPTARGILQIHFRKDSMKKLTASHEATQ